MLHGGAMMWLAPACTGSEASSSNLKAARGNGGAVRWEDAEREGLLHSRKRMYLRGSVSSAVSAALAHATGREASADALALKGLFDRRQLTVAGLRKWLVLDDQGSAAVMEACRLTAHQQQQHAPDATRGPDTGGSRLYGSPLTESAACARRRTGRR